MAHFGISGVRHSCLSPVSTTTLALIVTILLSVMGATGDYFLKLASMKERPLLALSFFIGLLVYGGTAIGWTYMMQHLRLGIIGGVYSVSMVLLCVILGMLFGERLLAREWVGIGLAAASLLLLTRFS